MQNQKVHKAVWVLVVVTLFLLSPMIAQANELTIYSGRNERFVLPLVEQFQKETGIRVNLLSGDAPQFVHRLQTESRRPQADLFISNDGALLEVARNRDLLMGFESPKVEVIPENFRAVDGSWVGLAARARVLMYNTELISEDEMPKSLFDLTDPKYRGEFALTRAGNASMVTHISAVRAIFGDEVTSELIEGILANEPAILRGHTDIRQAVGSGEYKFGLVNNYYYHLQLEEAENNNVAAIYPDQGEGEMGVFVNISGIGLVKNAPNKENAIAFIEFLLSDENQRLYSYTSKETPLVPGIEAVEYAVTIDQYKVADLHLSELGSVYDDTLDLMEMAGFAE